MKYVDEYRDPEIVRKLAEAIAHRVTRDWVLMEICGGQTHTIVRSGFDQMLPPEVHLVHGPGCPVCVTPLEIIDKATELAARPDVIFVSYGDLVRVPGSTTDLLHAKAGGGDIRIVYSPAEALQLARSHPRKQVIFFAVGFETTAPAHALALQQARRLGLRNFFMLVSHMLVPPAIRALFQSAQNRVQGLIAPGHVCTVAGYTAYEELAGDLRVPVVVAGFEPTDLLEAIGMLVLQLEEGRAQVENQYVRSVTRAGNLHAQLAVDEVFEVCDRKWRGLGVIPQSGLRIRDRYGEFDAETAFPLEERAAHEVAECISGQILTGQKKPSDCPAFAVACTPLHPLGAPMVSAEGACSAYYEYRRHAGSGRANA
ncbi:MAG TPA: hydrogenase formation protein HypD [Terriglobales bacterium]|nr:hydrogenase formation protein HypD [Terriglobales bacterium]